MSVTALAARRGIFRALWPHRHLPETRKLIRAYIATLREEDDQ